MKASYITQDEQSSQSVRSLMADIPSADWSEHDMPNVIPISQQLAVALDIQWLMQRGFAFTALEIADLYVEYFGGMPISHGEFRRRHTALMDRAVPRPECQPIEGR